MADSKIIIIMGTFNGEKYLIPQLQSIQEQTVQDWTLLIRDDGSSDQTLAIISDYCNSDHRILLVQDHNKRLGAAKNFAALMHEGLRQHADYLFFSDQDDFWLPDKLKNQLGCIKDMENRYGSETPLLVHSDLKVVDRNLKIIHESFMKYQGIRHINHNPLQCLIIRNFVTGCSTLINRSLLKSSLPLPDAAIIHDWWIALIAASCGRIEFMKNPSLLYRQHGNNEVGAKHLFKLYNPFGKEFADIWKNGKKHFKMTFEQAGALSQQLEIIFLSSCDDGIKSAKLLADEFSSCPSYYLGRRLRVVRDHGIRGYPLSFELLLYLRLILLNCSTTI